MTTQPNNPSPKVIEKLNSIHDKPDCRVEWAGQTYLEFPIGPFGKSVEDDKVRDDIYRGVDPGPYRILAVAKQDTRGHYSNVEYCLTMMHKKIGDAAYLPCDD
jgi:hypothetical protein